jgi:hypothetical protein
MTMPASVAAASEDLKKRTLLSLPGEIGKLVYIAATRDYNTGKYYHDGLAIKFTQEIANQALAACHQETFQRLVEAPLEELVGQLDEYIKSNTSEEAEVISTWLELEPFRVAIPLNCEPISAHLFCSNLRIALAILDFRAKHPQNSCQTALRRR